MIHGDPKISNILFDSDSGQAVSIIDLDTVKPGLLHYDIGDCLRSCCSRVIKLSGGEDSLEFDIDFCRELLIGYFSEMTPFLRDEDYEYIYPALRLITFELGLRFFTDHLEGDKYFKTDAAGENLKRALDQFRLLENIEDRESMITRIIDKCRQSGVYEFVKIVKERAK